MYMLAFSTVFHNFCLMFCGFLAGFLKIIAPRGGVLAHFFCPRGEGFALSLCSRGWAFPFQKLFPGGLPGGGGWSGLELTDTLSLY